MNRDGIRIEKIKSDHAELLKMVRNSIIENKGQVSESIKDVISVLDFDEKCIKRQEATLKAQELVESLTNEILEAKTKEEVFEIRKKLNYNINKIKAEIKKRNIDEKYLNDYQAKITYLRKDIAKYIRFLKREDNIMEIDRMYSNYKKLNLEELSTLKKALSKEVNYNRRNIKEFKEPKEVVSYEEEKVENEEIVAEVEIDESENPFKLESQKEELQEMPFSIKKDSPAPRRPGYYFEKSIRNVEFPEVETYLKSRIKSYNIQYGILPTEDYNKGKLSENIIHFIHNIPKYNHNKKIIKQMKSDYHQYYRGSDFKSYIEYLKKRNSIKEGLKCIFSRTHLYSNNTLIEHEKCSMWLYEFCRRNGMDIVFQKEKTI